MFIIKYFFYTSIRLKTMHDKKSPCAVTAAPNESKLKIKLVACNRSPDDGHKWLLTFEIIRIIPVFGPQLSEPGKTVEGFSFDTFQIFQPGDIINAHAEYLGDAHHGHYQLTRPEKTD